MPKVEWDYSDLAATYDQRADYSLTAIENVVSRIGCTPRKPVADIGAGTGKLSVPLGKLGLTVHSVEPNKNMRELGINNTKNLSVNWHEGTAEETTLPKTSFYATFFGSSFNVVGQTAALNECLRILVPGGWFVCIWNHRDLNDPLQNRIEKIIKSNIEDYDYGSRRKDPSDTIRKSGFFEKVEFVEDSFNIFVKKDNAVDAWKSHATLARQAKDSFDYIIQEIEKQIPEGTIKVPYTTRIWFSQLSADDVHDATTE